MTMTVTDAASRLCDGCKSEKPMYFCIDCDRAFCKSCDAYVHRLRKYITHKRVLFGDTGIIRGMCKHHPQEAATLYCKDCKGTY